MAWITVKKLDVMSVAKIYGVIMAIIGFAIGIFMAAIGGAVGAATGMIAMPGFGVLMIIIMPVFYGVLGFVLGAVGAFLYNLVAGRIGGIRFWHGSGRPR